MKVDQRCSQDKHVEDLMTLELKDKKKSVKFANQWTSCSSIADIYLLVISFIKIFLLCNQFGKMDKLITKH